MNEDDLVTYLPLSKWGFDRYGITYSASIKEDYEDTDDLFEDDKYTWEYMFEKDWSLFDDYNYNNNLYATIVAMENIADCREDLYVYTGEEDRMYFYKFVSETDSPSFKGLDEYGERIARYCKVTNDKIWASDFDETDELYIEIEQTPAAFMMILADLTASYCHRPGDANYYSYDKSSRLNEGTIPGFDIKIGFEVADKYDSAKFWFCVSGSDEFVGNISRFGGMVHGHMLGTYYFLSNDYNDELEIKSAKKIINEVHRKILENVI